MNQYGAMEQTTQFRAMTAVSSSNKAAETGSKKAGNMFLQKFQDFKLFPL